MIKTLVAICILLLAEVNVAVATQDKSTNIHVFMNGGSDIYDDLHVEYTQSIDSPASNPEIDPNGLTFDRNGRILNIGGTINPGTKITIKAYSIINGVQVQRYWWTSGGAVASPVISVQYEKVESDKKGHFKKEITVHKPVDSVKITVTSKMNIKTEDDKLIKKESAGTDTKITIEGDIDDKTKPGKIGVLIDPPDEVIDEVLEISPVVTMTVTGGYKLTGLFIAGFLIIFSLFAMRKKRWAG